MDTSSFSDVQQTYPDAELLPVCGSTCDCYRVKLYGKFHFMKRLKPELRTDPRYVSVLQKEFETGYRLDHPHLVRYVSKGEDYLLTEYVDGENLKAFSESHPDYFKSRKNADRILTQLLDVVGYLHQHQIVHLDLKPENILITRVGHELKLTDLGYCYTDTYTDTMGRTDKYAAPEQLDGSAKVDARTDIYAIGKILQTLPCSNIYNKVIRQCTKDDPDDRFQSIDEIVRCVFRSNRKFLLEFVSILLIIFAAVFLLLRRPMAVVKPEQANNDSIAIKQNESVMSVEQVSDKHTVPAMVSHQESAPSSQSVDSDTLILKEDTLALRKELQKIAQPYFDTILATYRDSSYQAIGFSRMSELCDMFREAIMSKYEHLWEKKYRRSYNMSEPTFYRECSETWLYYCNNLYIQMMRNDGDHSYDGKVYNYYDGYE